MKIAVLLTCHNRKEKTIKCLSNLFRQNVSPCVTFDVFLVNDGCTDGTEVAVKENYPQVTIIEGDGNLFWNRGMCLAWEESRKAGSYDGVIWLNDDTMLYPSALKSIIECYNKNIGSIVVGSIASTSDNSSITYGGYINKKRVAPVGDEYLICDTFNGNFVYIPRVVSDKIGYLDSYYRHSVGDYDYAWRAAKDGIRILASGVVGTCDRNPPEPIWNKGSLFARFKKLYSPLGNNPLETFHLYKKYSIIKAIGLYIYIHLRVLFSFFFPKKTF